MYSFKKFLVELYKNDISIRHRIDPITKHDESEPGWKREAIKTNTGHILYTRDDGDDDGIIEHRWVHPETGSLDLELSAARTLTKSGRYVYNDILISGKGAKITGHSNLAASAYNDLHRMGNVTTHNNQSEGAIETHRKLRESFPQTVSHIWDPKKQEATEFTSGKHISKKGPEKLGPGLTSYLQRVTLVHSLSDSKISRGYRQKIKDRKLLIHSD